MLEKMTDLTSLSVRKLNRIIEKQKLGCSLSATLWQETVKDKFIIQQAACEVQTITTIDYPFTYIEVASNAPEVLKQIENFFNLKIRRGNELLFNNTEPTESIRNDYYIGLSFLTERKAGKKVYDLTVINPFMCYVKQDGTNSKLTVIGYVNDLYYGIHDDINYDFVEFLEESSSEAVSDEDSFYPKDSSEDETVDNLFEKNADNGLLNDIMEDITSTE